MGSSVNRARRSDGIETMSHRRVAGCIKGGDISMANEIRRDAIEDGSLISLLWSRNLVVMMHQVRCHPCRRDKKQDE